MKRMFTLLMLCLLASGFFCCTKEGPRGRTGLAGQEGQDGNANVVSYLITDSTLLAWSSTQKIYLNYDSAFNIPDSIQNEGVVLVYMRYKTAPNYWYPAPGLGPDAFCMTRVSIGTTWLILSLYNPDGTPWSGILDITLTDLRIILISPSALHTLARKGIDLDCHDAVCEELGMTQN